MKEEENVEEEDVEGEDVEEEDVEEEEEGYNNNTEKRRKWIP